MLVVLLCWRARLGKWAGVCACVIFGGLASFAYIGEGQLGVVLLGTSTDRKRDGGRPCTGVLGLEGWKGACACVLCFVLCILKDSGSFSLYRRSLVGGGVVWISGMVERNGGRPGLLIFLVLRR